MEPLTHKPDSNHKEWNESYYLCFADTKNNLRGMSRMGFKPNKPEGMTFLFFFLPDGSAAGYHATEEVESYSNPFSVESVTHECIESEKVWHYSFNGNMVVVENPEDFPKVREYPELISDFIEVKMDINFKPLNDVYEYSEHMTKESLELGRKAGDKHWEQIALISGEINLSEEKFVLDNVLGQRDHTYGIREWTGVGNWLYYVVWFNENLAINPAAIITDDGRLSTGGFLFKNGKNIPLKTIKVIDQQFREDGVLPISSELEIVDTLNEKHILKGYPGPIIPIPFKDEEGKETILVQSFGTFELDNITGGYGTFETLRK